MFLKNQQLKLAQAVHAISEIQIHNQTVSLILSWSYDRENSLSKTKTYSCITVLICSIIMISLLSSQTFFYLIIKIFSNNFHTSHSTAHSSIYLLLVRFFSTIAVVFSCSILISYSSSYKIVVSISAPGHKNAR